MYEDEFQAYFSNFTMIQRLTSLRLLLYWDRFGYMRGKDRILEEGEGKTRGREIVETIISLKTNLICFYL